jgi:hypothetical protein
LLTQKINKMRQKLLLLLVPVSIVLLQSCTKEMSSAPESVPSAMAMAKMNKAVPIKGSYTTSAEILQAPPMLLQRITGVGSSSHLGKSTFVALPTLNFTTPPPFNLSGTAVFTAANGDEFYTWFTGTATPNGQGENIVVMTHSITGGTGRFTNASGTIIGNTVAVPGHTEGFITYEGTIKY